jgi:hypothetical protein
VSGHPSGCFASTGDEAKFTINLVVVGKADWDEVRTTTSYYSAKPSPNSVGFHRYAQRAGHLTHGQNHWYRLAGDGSNEQQIGAEVLDNLRNIIVPKLKSENGGPDARTPRDIRGSTPKLTTHPDLPPTRRRGRAELSASAARGW